MFLKYKAKKAAKKIISGASPKEIRNSLQAVMKEASKQLARKSSKFSYRIPMKVTVSR